MSHGCLAIPLLLVTSLGLVRAESSESALDAERLFDTSRLVDVRIEMADEDWRALRSQTRDFGSSLRRERAESPFTYFKGDVVIDGVRVESVGIRKKGFLGSLDEERPSLKIKFSEYEEKEPIAGVDRLTLNNNKQDDSLTYQLLGYRLFTRAGAPAPRCNLAHVTVNGVELGVYSNVESIKAPFLERHFGDASGSLYEGTLADLFPDRLDRFEPKRNTEDATATLGRVSELLATTDELEVEELERLIDIDAFLTFWAVESLISFWDGYTNNQNNFFLYQSPKNSKLYWIPWGLDAAFSAPPPIPFMPRSPPSVQAHAVLANRLYHHEATRERYRARLLELLETIWNEEKLLGAVDEIQALAEGHRHRRQRNFEIRLGGVRWFIRERRAAVLGDLRQWPADVPERPRIPMHTTEAGRARGTFATTWRKRSPKDPYSEGSAELELELHGETVTFKQLGVSAEPGQGAPGDLGGGPRPPAVVFTGRRESDGRKIVLGFATPRDLFRPDSGPVRVQGMLLQGEGFLAMGSFRLLSGTATFDKAETTPGAPVEGHFEVAVLHIQMQ